MASVVFGGAVSGCCSAGWSFSFQLAKSLLKPLVHVIAINPEVNVAMAVGTDAANPPRTGLALATNAGSIPAASTMKSVG
jgi:hypothetical protein